MHAIPWNKRFFHVIHLYKKLDFLKLTDIYEFELAKSMHELFNDKLPLIFQRRFEELFWFTRMKPEVSKSVTTFLL